MPKPDITIAIPTYNRGEALINTINDCLKQSHKNIEVIAIDQTKQYDPNISKKLSMLSDERFKHYFVDPPSVTAAKNFALKIANAPIILFLDDDVEFDQNLAKNYLETFKKMPDVSAVAGRVLQAGFPIQKDVLKFDDLAVSRGVFTATEPGYTNAFPGGNVAMKVSDALKVGGFDTRYYWNAFREESDMSMKMTKAGMKIYYEPKAVLTHLAIPSGGSRTNTYKDIRDTEMFYRNELFFTLRMADRKLSALRHKHTEYCRLNGVLLRRRTLYFCKGLVAALWRIVFGKKIVAKVRAS